MPVFSRRPSEDSAGRSVVANVLGLGVAGAAGIVLLLLIAAFHGPEALGRFNLLFALYLIASQIATVGLHVSVVRHLSTIRVEIERGPVLRGALAATLLTAGTTSALLLLTREIISTLIGRPDLAPPMRWVALGIVLFALNKVLLAALTAIGELRLHAVLVAVRGGLALLALGVLTMAGVSGGDLVLTLVLAEAGLLLPLIIALWSEMRLRNDAVILGGWVARHLRFGLLGAGSSLLTELNVRVDVLVLAVFVDDRAIGIYTFVALLAEAALQLPMVYRTVLGPRIVQLIEAADEAGLRALVRSTRGRLWSLMAVLSSMVILAQPIVVRALGADSDFLEGRVVLTVLLGGVLVASGYFPFGLILAHGGRPLAQSGLMAGLVAINLVGNLLLIPRFGLLGAAGATALVHAVSVPCVRWSANLGLGLRI